MQSFCTILVERKSGCLPMFLLLFSFFLSNYFYPILFKSKKQKMCTWLFDLVFIIFFSLKFSIQIIPNGIKSKGVSLTRNVPEPVLQSFEHIATTQCGNKIFQIKYSTLADMEAWEYRYKAKLMDSVGKTERDIHEAAFRNLLKSRKNKQPKPIYGVESTESLFEIGSPWSMNEFTSAQSIIHRGENRMTGINTSLVNLGMRFTWFPIHTEDCDLGSLNYLHFGEPKLWYCVSSTNANKFEAAVYEHISKIYECNTPLCHKTFIVTPAFLQEYDIPYSIVTQNAGEIVATMYRAYHWGFNTGYNVCESVNIATPIYESYYKNAKVCGKDCL